MPVTIRTDGAANSLVYEGNNPVSVTTVPDVCKTTSPRAPVAIGYPDVSESVPLANGTTYQG
jgi:hypothetical protein